jgi:phenylacetate-CoA ligase
MRRFGAEYAYGYPSVIRAFADECMRLGLDGAKLGIRVVISTGELLTPENRRVLSAYFGCPVVNEYGCSEAGVLGFECERGSMHVVPVAAYPEILSDEGLPVQSQDPGQVVITDLYGDVEPLMRYRLGDRAAWKAGGCSCGRALRLLEVNSGRIDSFIRTPHRGKVYDAILAYTVPAGISQFRARQVEANLITADIVVSDGFQREPTIDECRRAWEAALGPGMTVTLRAVEQIAAEPSGKLRYFVPLADSRHQGAE